MKTLQVEEGNVLAVKISGHMKRFKFGYVPEGESARQVYQGPLVPGPWVYTYGLCAVIDNYGGSGAERERNLADGIEFDIESGDRLIIHGETYVAKAERKFGEIRLDLEPEKADQNQI